MCIGDEMSPAYDPRSFADVEAHSEDKIVLEESWHVLRRDIKDEPLCFPSRPGRSVPFHTLRQYGKANKLARPDAPILEVKAKEPLRPSADCYA